MGISLDLTPLIDIVFLLVIFFLVASQTARNESNEKVELPLLAGQATDSQDQVTRRLVVTVTSDQSLHVGGQIVTLEQVTGLLERARADSAAGDYEVRIRGDRRVPFRVVEPLMVACAQAGITRIGYAVLPR
jgi:biopolymer transport protein ExbD